MSTLVNEIAKAKVRPLYEIATEIKKDWRATAKDGRIYFGAVPYLDAMQSLDSINDNYIMDNGRSIVVYFLANASTYKGAKAKELKDELKAMLKSK
jgi:hypothetical protein